MPTIDFTDDEIAELLLMLKSAKSWTDNVPRFDKFKNTNKHYLALTSLLNRLAGYEKASK